MTEWALTLLEDEHGMIYGRLCILSLPVYRYLVGLKETIFSSDANLLFCDNPLITGIFGVHLRF